MTPLKQRWKIRRTYIYTKGEDQTDTYIYYKIEQHDSTKTKGEDQTDIYIYKAERSDGHIYILRGKIRRHIYTIRLNNRPPLKQRGKIRRTHINTKGEDQMDIHIYYKIEQHDSTKTKGEDQTDLYIYKGGRSDGHIYIY
jgi:hypothetical protein